MNAPAPEIVVTTADHNRLQRLIEQGAIGEPLASRLQSELDRANVVEPDELPSDVIAVERRVLVEDVDSRERLDLQLVWPADADIDAGRVSVLAPVGTALLGLRVGQVIEWPMPTGRKRKLRVLEVSAPTQGPGAR